MDLPLWFNTSLKVLVLETLAFPPQHQGVGPEGVCVLGLCLWGCLRLLTGAGSSLKKVSLDTSSLVHNNFPSWRRGRESESVKFRIIPSIKAAHTQPLPNHFLIKQSARSLWETDEPWGVT